jgi:integrase
MYRRRSSFWAWTEEEWVETLGVSHTAFLEHHGITYASRTNVIVAAYLLGGFTDLRKVGAGQTYAFARRVFNHNQLEEGIERIIGELKRWGYAKSDGFAQAKTTISEALIMVRSSHIEDITLDVLGEIRKRIANGRYVQTYALAISKALVNLGILSESLPEDLRFNSPRPDIGSIGGSPDWTSWCNRWRSTSTLERETRKTVYYSLLIAGRWLSEVHPEITSPEQWTRQLAAEYVAAVDRAAVGQWTSGLSYNRKNKGKPLAPYTKAQYLYAIRTFFKDCYEWEWIEQRFDPTCALKTPASVMRLIKRDARVIDDDIWAKLLWAGLNLTVDDLPKPNAAVKNRGLVYYYPLEMMKAVVIVWLFGGLRRSEIRRLRVGCVQWQREGLTVPDTIETLPKDAICLLRVPACKFSQGYVKPVDRVVGEAIDAWERVRTDTPLMLDSKTNENVCYLFAHRTKPIGAQFINNVIIPMLCRKAEIPERDARGNITSHRARSTIANQLSEFMTLVELMEWLGHSDPTTALHYVKTSIAKLSKAYKNSDYFGRNLRTAGITIDETDSSTDTLQVSEGGPDTETALTQLIACRATVLSIGKNVVVTDEQRSALNATILALDNLCKKVSSRA